MNANIRSRSLSSKGSKSGITPREQYAIARAYIEHENTLVGQRTTWYLTFQGLLFTALFVAIGLFDPAKFPIGGIARKHLVVAIFFLGLMGFVSSMIAYVLIKAAYSQIDRVTQWWNDLGHPAGMFPPVTGQGGFTFLGHRLNPSHFLIMLCLIWLGMMAIFANVVRQLA